jgi:AP2 domain-containing protein
MKTITLTKGLTALVDDSDYAWLSQYKWCADSDGYAVRSERTNGRKHNVSMHRLIMNAQPGQEIDHKDWNKVNNQRVNLRFASETENRHNTPLSSRNTSGYKGVSWYKRHKKWEARIKIGKRNIRLGLYQSKEDAARAYNAAALEFIPDFAYINEIPSET